MGGGAWATACGQVLADAGHNVVLWARSEAVVNDINEKMKMNQRKEDVVETRKKRFILVRLLKKLLYYIIKKKMLIYETTYTRIKLGIVLKN